MDQPTNVTTIFKTIQMPVNTKKRTLRKILTTNADVKRIRSRTQSKEQSKFTKSHLFELVLNESAYSIP